MNMAETMLAKLALVAYDQYVKVDELLSEFKLTFRDVANGETYKITVDEGTVSVALPVQGQKRIEYVLTEKGIEQTHLDYALEQGYIQKVDRSTPSKRAAVTFELAE